jgi:geranylgeranylglycerol-phosphate geranylgeranyltransferase
MFFFPWFSLIFLPFSQCFLSAPHGMITQRPLHKPYSIIYPTRTYPLLLHDDPSIQEEKRIFKKMILSKLKKKTGSLLKLIRYKNLFPTFLLSLTGGWLIHPSLPSLFRCSTFVAAIVNTLLIMSSSMVINDLFDIDIDKINHPDRPLVTGEVTRLEAIAFSSAVLGISQYITFHFLPEYLQTISNSATLQIIFYTPVFKKMLFIKNLSCACLVSFAVFFAGLASSQHTFLPLHKNFGVFSLVLTLIFMGSLYNELLLDMRDYDGDKQNGILTIPVIIGQKYSWVLSNGILGFNMISNYLALSTLVHPSISFLFLIIMSPMMVRSMYIKKSEYSKESIVNAVNKTNKQLFLVLLYFCSISTFSTFSTF